MFIRVMTSSYDWVIFRPRGLLPCFRVDVFVRNFFIAWSFRIAVVHFPAWFKSRPLALWFGTLNILLTRNFLLDWFSLFIWKVSYLGWTTEIGSIEPCSPLENRNSFTWKRRPTRLIASEATPNWCLETLWSVAEVLVRAYISIGRNE